MNILGISCFYHDAAAALIRDGVLIAAAEEERFSRKKHDYSFPAQAVKFCLESGKITAQELDYVVFYEKPFLKFERLLFSILATYPRSWVVFRDSMMSWLSEKLWARTYLKEKLGIPESKNKIPDLLDEVAWGLRWVLSMQDASGAFRAREAG